MSSTLRRRVLAPAAAVGALSLVLAGCAADTDEPGAGGDLDCSAYEAYGTFEGESVEVYATIVEVEADDLVPTS